MTFSFSIALAVFQQFELTGANYLNMELQMENAAGKLFHSQAFSLALLASGCTTCFAISWGGKASDRSLCSQRSQGLCEVNDLPAEHPILHVHLSFPCSCSVPTPRCSLGQERTLPDLLGNLHASNPIMEKQSLLQSHNWHQVSTINQGWPFPDPVFKKALIYKAPHQQGNW